MKCQNCGKNNANVRYTQIINGEKKEFILCEECAEKLGINSKIHFDMNMNFGSILGDFFDEYKSNYGLLGDFPELEPERCEKQHTHRLRKTPDADSQGQGVCS